MHRLSESRGVATLSYAGLMSCAVQVYTDTAALDGISLESPCHPVREFQITGLVRHPNPPPCLRSGVS